MWTGQDPENKCKWVAESKEIGQQTQISLILVLPQGTTVQLHTSASKISNSSRFTNLNKDRQYSWVSGSESKITTLKISRNKKRKLGQRSNEAASSLAIFSKKKQTKTRACRVFIWAWMLETETHLLRKGLWDPSRGWSQILLRLGAAGFGTQDESSKRWGQCICFCFLQHIQQNVPLGRPKEGLVHHTRFASFLSWSTSWEFAWVRLSEVACLIFWWPFAGNEWACVANRGRD